ncbi:MAG: hypothetical protein Q4B22_08885 [Eubacteriales bacterium]|nr:hypothetical protein [Eubacteriales bacterium]
MKNQRIGFGKMSAIMISVLFLISLFSSAVFAAPQRVEKVSLSIVSLPTSVYGKAGDTVKVKIKIKNEGNTTVTMTAHRLSKAGESVMFDSSDEGDEASWSFCEPGKSIVRTISFKLTEEDIFEGTIERNYQVLDIYTWVDKVSGIPKGWENNDSGTSVTDGQTPFDSNTVSIKIPLSAEPPKQKVMYRLYNPNSGEHFYTASTGERASVIAAGWDDEDIGWIAPEYSNTPVYRLYNPNAGDHHYTMNADERDWLVKVGWNDEGIGWYSDDEQRYPLYRQYNPNAIAGAHNFTTSKKENDYLVKAGWVEEGIAWHAVMPTPKG